MKFTDGPWKTDKYGIVTDGPHFCTFIGAVCLHQPKNNADALNARAKASRLILQGNQRNMPKESVANAALIASAPELVECLQALMGTCCHRIEWKRKWPNVVKRCKAALALAGGGE